MSLNGLDNPEVREAHEAAAAEPGGWFLLKYASRDEVDLLARGNGGIVEVRNNITKYEEKSPLFGFLRYRRRNVIIKYLPEDCSRLIQARVTVHFNAVCEKFTPYNTLFSISTAKELTDTKLSAACSLHAASGSTSSSTSSLRRRRLMEIAEEEEEEQQRCNKRKSAVAEDDIEQDDSTPVIQSTSPPHSPEPPVTLNSELAASPEARKFSTSSDPPDFVGAARPESPADFMDSSRPMSSHTARPELYTYSTYTYGKPKVKLAPRPSLDVNARPKTAGNFRAVSQMPAGFKLYSKGSKRQKSRDDNAPDNSHGDATSEIAFAPSPNDATAESQSITLGEDLTKPPNDLIRPATSSGASATSPTMPTFPGSAKPTMTPEKARLMKAMQLREKKKMMMSVTPVEAAGSPDTPLQDVEDGDAQPTARANGTVDNELEPLSEEDERRLSMVKPDSSVVADASSASLPTDPCDSARSDSGPESPLILSSEPDQSTKASSLSESTDETVQETRPKTDLDGTEDLNNSNNHDTAGEDQATTAAPATAEVVLESDESSTQSETQQTDVGRETALDCPDSQDHSGTSEPIEQESSKDTEPTQQESGNSEAAEMSLAAPTSELPSEVAETPAVVVSDSVADEVNETEDAASTHVENTPNSSQPSPKFAIPKSKFSTQDSSYATAPTFDLRMASTGAADNDVADGETGTSKPSGPKIAVEPIRTDVDASNRRPTSRLSDDEEFMNELQSANVEQAQSILVAKSPVTPVFPTTQAADNDDGMFGSKEGTPRGVIRTTSNPVRGSFLAPADVSQSSARSVSSGAAFLHKITQQQTSSHQKNLAKSGKLGSNISQRIKALEKLSGSSGDRDAPPPRSSVPSSTFFAVRKSSTREPSRSPSVADRASSLTRGSPTRSAISESRDGSPELRVPRERSGSVASRLSMFEVPSVPPAHTMPRGRPESVMVTARIIRDGSQAGGVAEPPKDPSEFSRLDLKVSPLEVSHEKAGPPALAPAFDAVETSSPAKEMIRERRMSKEKRRSQSLDPAHGEGDVKSRRSSLSVVRDFIKDSRKSLTSASTDALAGTGTASGTVTPVQSPSRPPSTSHGNSLGRRLSISSRRSSISRDGGNPAMSPSMFTEGSASGDDSKSTNSDKKKGRAGRFMRRLSSSFTSSRNKNLGPTNISPTVHEEDLSEVAAANAKASVRTNQQQQQQPQAAQQPQQPSIVSYMGDVNVQFPDNLLWKRRAMCLDSQGFLILSATTAAAPSRDKLTGAGVKRYHLSEFGKPYTPDVEVQELPNSVVLDFLEGSGLQIACEDRAGQMNVLRILQEAHQNHTSFGQ